MWHARTGESEESWSQGQGGQAGAAPGPGECGAGVRGAATRPGAARRSPSPARSEFTDALLDQLKVLGDPESVPSAFQAEVATGVVLGNMSEAGTKQGIKPETTRELLVEAIRHMVAGLERRTPPCAYPVLRALAALAPPEVAEYAAGAAAELAADRALPGSGDGTAPAAAGAPPWVDDLARVTPGVATFAGCDRSCLPLWTALERSNGAECLRKLTAPEGQDPRRTDERWAISRGQRLAAASQQGAVKTGEHRPRRSGGCGRRHEQARSELPSKTTGACHVTEDEFGETLAVLCEFSYRGGTEPARLCPGNSALPRF